MAKRKKPDPSSSEDAALNKKISRAIRRLGLIDSRCEEGAFYSRAADVLGEDDITEWLEAEATGSLERIYDFQYSSPARALITSVSWRSWPLEVEMRWILPRLLSALKRSRSPEPYLVEIGAGPGAAAAVASAVLGVPVIATDVHPQALGLPEHLSSLTNGDVRSVVSEALEVSNVFLDHPPVAVFGLGIFRYVIPHKHKKGSFSYLHSAQTYTQEVPDPKAVSFFESIAPAELLLAEQICEDYLGEIARDGNTAGYGFADSGIERLTHRIPGEESACVCLHLTSDHSRQSDTPAMIQLAGPLPSIAPGLNVHDVTAEATRERLEIDELHDVVEFSWPDGSVLRREFFSTGQLYGLYRSSNLGYRSLQIVSAGEVDTLRRDITDEDSRFQSPDIRRSTLAESSTFW